MKGKKKEKERQKLAPSQYSADNDSESFSSNTKDIVIILCDV